MPCPPEEENFDMFDSLKTKLPRTMRAILAAICVATSRAGGWLAADDFTSNGVTFKVQTYIPDGTSQASYPMTLCLHSSGSLGTDNAKQLGSGEPCYIWADWKAQREPTILVAPQLASGAWFEDPAAAAIRELVKTYLNGTRSVGLAVNASRAFVTGHSNGAGGTWKLLDDDARLFAGLRVGPGDRRGALELGRGAEGAVEVDVSPADGAEEPEKAPASVVVGCLYDHLAAVAAFSVDGVLVRCASLVDGAPGPLFPCCVCHHAPPAPDVEEKKAPLREEDDDSKLPESDGDDAPAAPGGGCRVNVGGSPFAHEPDALAHRACALVTRGGQAETAPPPKVKCKAARSATCGACLRAPLTVSLAALLAASDDGDDGDDLSLIHI